MNLGRGLNRLLAVFAICWYLGGALYLYAVWTSAFSRHQFELNRCLEATQPTKSEPQQLSLTEAECRDHYRQQPNEWGATIAIILLPVVIYGAGRIAKWIAAGFRSA